MMLQVLQVSSLFTDDTLPDRDVHNISILLGLVVYTKSLSL